MSKSTNRSRRGHKEDTAVRIRIEGWQCLSEQVHVALDVGRPALF